MKRMRRLRESTTIMLCAALTALCAGQALAAGIAAAKVVPDGTPVTLQGCIVTQARFWEGCYYLGEMDRTGGIRIAYPGFLATGDSVRLTGAVGTNSNGERYVQTNMLIGSFPTPLTQAFFMNNSAVGGAPAGPYQPGVWTWRWVHQPGQPPELKWLPCVGPNNIGSLVRTSGVVTEVEGAGRIYIDDGAHLMDYSKQHVGIRVEFGPDMAFFPSVGDYVLVGGACSCVMDPVAYDPIVRILLVSDWDITVF